MPSLYALQAVIFDLDGVIVSTDDCHYRAWKSIADEEKIYFDRQINERLRGISRMESLEIILEKAGRTYTQEEKGQLAGRKNDLYVRFIEVVTKSDILSGVMDFINGAKAARLKTAIASSSRNTDLILERIGLSGAFDTVVTGNDIKKSKPDPEVFILAAKRLGADASKCLVVEDSYAGIDAAIAGGMKSLSVGFAAGYEKGDFHAESLSSVSINDILRALNP